MSKVKIQKNKLDDLVNSHKGLAKLLGFEYKNIRVGAGGKQIKVIVALDLPMNELLDYKIEDVTEYSKMDNKANNQQDKQASPSIIQSMVWRQN